jgi:Tol biopolymer transport system component
MHAIARSMFGVLCLLAVTTVGAEPARRTVNDGNLVMEDIPPIPAEIVEDLNRYQNVRSGFVDAWTGDGKGLYISTRFGDVSQLHRVDMPGGARRQITFYDEPVGAVARQPLGSKLLFTRDAGGSEFAQIFLLDPADGSATMLTDGESRNGAMVWDRKGRRVAFQTTRRNGASNDVWMMDPFKPSTAEMILESPDGTWWGPVEFSSDGKKVLIVNFVSVADSRVLLLDLDSRKLTLLAGGEGDPSSNLPVGFDDGKDGFWFITDQGGEFQRLAWQSLKPGATAEIITAEIPWDVDGGNISHDRSRMAFAVNDNGRVRVYLMDTRTRKYRSIARPRLPATPSCSISATRPWNMGPWSAGP